MAEQEFIDKVPEGHHCTICTKVFGEPVLTECCGQHFCKQCLENWFQKTHKRTKTCPHCRSKEFNYIVDLRLKRDINGLKIFCPNRKQGCDRIFACGELDSHLATCSFVTVVCKNNCGISLLRINKRQHRKQLCPRRKVKCQHCGVSGTHLDITTSHLETCPDVPIVCPRKCGEMGIKRKDLETHKQKCSLEPVQCPFFEAGCKEEIPRKDLDVHTSSSTQQHLQLVMTTSTRNYAQLKTQHDSLTKQHQELQHKYNEIERRNRMVWIRKLKRLKERARNKKVQE